MSSKLIMDLKDLAHSVNICSNEALVRVYNNKFDHNLYMSYLDNYKSELAESEKERLRSFFDGKDLSDSTVYLCGYADSATGSMDANWMLGEKRASRVATFIMEDIRAGVKGVVASVGGGTDRFGSVELNRCVEIKVEKGSK